MSPFPVNLEHPLVLIDNGFAFRNIFSHLYSPHTALSFIIDCIRLSISPKSATSVYRPLVAISSSSSASIFFPIAIETTVAFSCSLRAAAIVANLFSDRPSFLRRSQILPKCFLGVKFWKSKKRRLAVPNALL